MNRHVQAEILDVLPPGHPAAQRSRVDLRRLNRVLGHARMMTRLLNDLSGSHPPTRLIELGAGDGSFALELARRLSPRWSGVEMLLVDRLDLVDEDTRGEFERTGWKLRTLQADVFEWMEGAARQDGGCILANLFLHHFPEPALQRLLEGVAAKSALFAACEPRRSPVALALSRLVGWMGCNPVTRYDAPVSVRAGFRDRELTDAWPVGAAWLIQERRAGFASHIFCARRSMLSQAAVAAMPRPAP